MVLTMTTTRRSLLIFWVVLLACCTVTAQWTGDGPGRAAPSAGSIAYDVTWASAHSRSTETKGAKITSLCTEQEKIVWSCETKGRKIVSICSSRELTKEHGYLQYRFGRPGRVELEYPRQRQNSQTAFKYFRYTRPLVTYLGLRFKAGEYDYEVYDNSNEEAGGGSESGVTVTPSGNTAGAVDYRCRKPVVHHLIELEEVVPNTEMTPGGP